MKRQLAAIALTGLAFSAVAGTDEAHAASQICNRLESRLAALAGDNTADRRVAQRHAGAIRTQQRQIAKTQRQRRRAGCEGSIIRPGRDADNACGSLDRTLERMHRNLRKLQREHNALAGGGPEQRRERRRLLASLEANRCRIGVPGAPQLVRQAPGVFRVAPRAPQEHKKRYRTMCVRTCDGYHFPISEDVPRDAFDRDAARCVARCPGTKVELYVEQIAGADDNASNRMISRAGASYRELPNAFLYRQPDYQRPPQCGCSPSMSDSIIGDEEAAAPASKDAEVSGSENTAVENAGTEPRPAKAAPTAKAEAEAEGKVRVVGPEFLPDPEAAIDLRAPARTRAP